ncbi:hypothetical protein [Methylobacterium sp. Leaf112]|uniref:hypothetical protein n=1 Tax=Methylobacterium sp. Leaf112 TaxID=1736258 RepID=UPI0006FE8FF6|nr:hypothetical protein [Methylobacterium sp. Leaf112]KQP62136.1 hypothetical protein ASF52_05620 [Methylobacterium sp. Leaf112]
MSLDRKSLIEAGLLLMGPEWKRPLAKVLGQYHPDGPRDTVDPRLPYRWSLEPDPEKGKLQKDQSRPIPEWVGPVLAKLLAERADDLAADAKRARALAARIKGE